MSELRVRLEVIGPGRLGYVRVRAGERTTEVSLEQLPAELRLPNASFVAVMDGTDFVRVDPEGEAWLLIQDGIRPVLNSKWDPEGTAGSHPDAYDHYLPILYGMLRRGSSDERIAEFLLAVETEDLFVRGSPGSERLGIARELRALELPAVDCDEDVRDANRGPTVSRRRTSWMLAAIAAGAFWFSAVVFFLRLAEHGPSTPNVIAAISFPIAAICQTIVAVRLRREPDSGGSSSSGP